LPSEIELETSRELAATPATLYPSLVSQEGIRSWWHLTEAEAEAHGMPPMDVEAVAGPSEGPGTKVRFVAGGFTLEDWTILETVPGERVRYEIDFQVFIVERTLTLEPVGDASTKMTWHERGTIQNPLMRWMTMFGGKDQAIENFQGAMGLLEQRANAGVPEP
jgi:uncharacterized protein YndB with AHSA1/START domain